MSQRPTNPDGAAAGRRRLAVNAVVIAAGLVLVLVLILQNRHRVRVGWVFGHSDVSLVWLVILSAFLGWVIGVATMVVLRRRRSR